MVLLGLVLAPIGAAFRLGTKAFGWSAADVVSGLRNNQVTELNVSFHRFTDQEWCQVFDALKANSSCTNLILAGSNLSDKLMVHLASALKENRSVVDLSVADNPFADEGARALAAALRARGRPRMQELCYETTHMGRSGRRALAEVEVENGWFCRRAGGPIESVLFGYFPQQSELAAESEAPGLPFGLSKYKDAYDHFSDPPSDLRLGRSS